MPAHCRPRLRRPGVIGALLLGLLGVLGLLVGPAAGAAAAPNPSEGPHLTLPEEVTFVLGRPGDTYVIEAAGDPAPAIGVDRLPAGLRLTAHSDGSATIEGTPIGPTGPTTVRVEAQSTAGMATGFLTVVVQQAPSFADRGPLVFGLGEYASVLVRTDGYPVPGIGLDGDLPAGLSFFDNDDGTALIAGTPVEGPDSFPVRLTAMNVVADASLSTAIRVVDRSATTARSAGPVGPVHVVAPRREP